MPNRVIACQSVPNGDLNVFCFALRNDVNYEKIKRNICEFQQK